jgi:hypothetical protein
MFEYILVVSICSVIEKSCGEEIHYKTRFPTHKACAIKGYEDSLNFMKNLDNKIANEKKVYTKFGCIEVEKINA